MNTDPIADYLTRIRNAMKARHKVVSIPASKTKESITKILLDQGYIKGYALNSAVSAQGSIEIGLKYNSSTKEPAIMKLLRISKPGLRKYAGKSALPQVINGLGIAVISTPKGVITDKEARKTGVGGEVLCYIY